MLKRRSDHNPQTRSAGKGIGWSWKFNGRTEVRFLSRGDIDSDADGWEEIGKTALVNDY